MYEERVTPDSEVWSQKLRQPEDVHKTIKSITLSPLIGCWGIDLETVNGLEIMVLHLRCSHAQRCWNTH